MVSIKMFVEEMFHRKLEESKDVFTHNTEKWNIDKGNKPATKRHGAALSHEKGKELQW